MERVGAVSLFEAEWLRGCLDVYSRAVASDRIVPQLIDLKSRIVAVQAAGGKMILAGNGASAAIASHAAVDFTKTAGVRAVNFNEADLITCLANDYGYERWLEKALEFHADAADLVLLISSSGRSPNIVRAAEHSRSRGLQLVSLTGFASDNPVGRLADLNLWVDSHAYNVVEATHQIWLSSVCDLIVGSVEYAAVK